MPDLIETFEDGVATLTMNRPQARNAMSGEMMVLMNEAVRRHAADPETRCLVLTGAGGAFCAGGDVKGFAKSASANDPGHSKPTLEARTESLREAVELSRILHEMPKPTLAIMGGAAAGGGLSLALACDLRFALDTAKITTAFSKIGTSGDYGGSYFLPYLVGAAKARELYFTGDVISGEEAYRIGLVTKFAASDTFEVDATNYARYLATLPTQAIGFMKRNLNSAFQGTLDDVFRIESENMMRSFDSEDHKRASVAFVQKNPPVFIGR
jgi:2-(1,2-epoxy-1,2-dihydrophenyl)acetyl-CoA isomerase